MDASLRERAGAVRAQLSTGQAVALREALAAISPVERDAWIDLVLGLGELPADDRASLPRGCVPYLPAPVDALLAIAEHADVRPGDVFVDVGSGIGRAAVLMHLLTGAAAIGLEIQPELARASRDLAARLGGGRVAIVEGDAARTVAELSSGSVFFLYCPFSGDRLRTVLAGLEAIARARPIRVCCLDLPLPACAWLGLSAQPSPGLDLYRSDRSDEPIDAAAAPPACLSPALAP
ncbi:MAG TPA: hypothetical protein VHE35_30180 [Kofleriaceae bacterium]|nr:hypothetical protein [Kofleriaceae bacterium]